MIKVLFKIIKYFFAFMVGLFLLYYIFVQTPPQSPRKDETMQERFVRERNNLRNHQKKNIFKYIHTAIHEEKEHYRSYLGNIIGEDSGRYYWNAWNKQELIPSEPYYHPDERNVIVRLKSLNNDGYILFKYYSFDSVFWYCGMAGTPSDERLASEVVEFRNDEAGNAVEYKTHKLAYSETYRGNECNNDVALDFLRKMKDIPIGELWIRHWQKEGWL